VLEGAIRVLLDSGLGRFLGCARSTLTVRTTSRGAPVPRTTEEYQAIIGDLVKTLVAFAEQHDISTEEYIQALSFLTEVGRDDEMILLGDVLHLSIAIDDMTHRAATSGTATNVEGPFYLTDNPELKPPYRLCSFEEPGEPLLVTGRVTDSSTGSVVPGAILDLWQASADGFYEQQKPERGPHYLRGKVPADQDGRFEFRTVVPASYEIPKEGPVGRLLAYLDRHAFRANHIHLKLDADGYEPLTTQIFFSDNKYLRSDTVGAVKDELIVDLTRDEDEVRAKELQLRAPFFTTSFDIGLRRQEID
jgi:protocatechuate 3,4-dioxygenase beta subunit